MIRPIQLIRSCLAMMGSDTTIVIFVSLRWWNLSSTFLYYFQVMVMSYVVSLKPMEEHLGFMLSLMKMFIKERRLDHKGQYWP